MTEHIHRMEDGRLLLGRNVVTKEERTLNLPEACHLRPIADDMACAHPKYQGTSGRRVDQANLLLRQIVDTPETRYVLLPNQYIGAWKVGFMAEWIPGLKPRHPLIVRL